MARLDFSYCMELTLSEAVKNHRFTLRCIPADRQDQIIRSLRLEVVPEGVLSYGTDSFGNLFVYGTRQAPHSRFSVSLCGTADTSDTPPVLPEERFLGMYRVNTGLTKPGPAICSLYDSLPVYDGDPLARAAARMDQVHTFLRYTPGTTAAETTAEQAAEAGQGVCQDYAHILLSLLRMDFIPCRYVCGLMSGEGASHAWVEVAAGGSWIALDPTNRCSAGEHYLVFSTGRDALDCSINRGLYQGFALQENRVSARVTISQPSSF